MTDANDVSSQENEYDGLNRRIKKTVGVDTYDYYYNQQWQVNRVRAAKRNAPFALKYRQSWPKILMAGRMAFGNNASADQSASGSLKT